MEDKVDQIPSKNIGRENDVSGSTFLVFRFLFASICYYYEHLDRTLHEKNGLGGSLIFIATARSGEF